MSSEPAAPARSVLVLDANILVRAVLGRRVLAILLAHSRRVRRVDFFAPILAFEEAGKNLPAILARRSPAGGAAPEVGELLRVLGRFVVPVPLEVYAAREQEARQRVARRDENDWPYVALALTMQCPIWTEDRDFFGSGIATWTTDTVEIFLSAVS